MLAASYRGRRLPNIRRIAVAGLIRPLFVSASLVVVLEIAACSYLPSHIHDSDRAARTSKLAGLVDDYGSKSPAMYDTLLKSSRTIASEQDKLIAGLGGNRGEAMNQLLPFKNGAQLGAELSIVCKALGDTQDQLKRDVDSYLKEKAGVNAESKSATAAISAAQAKLAEAQKNVTAWNATVAVLEKGVAESPSIEKKSSKDNKQAGLDSLKENITAVADTDVTYVDATTGKGETRRIRDVLSDQINVKADGTPLISIPDAPGATLAILTLGVDLARIQRQAAQLRMTQLSTRLQLYERVEAETLLAKALLSTIGELNSPGVDACTSHPTTLIVLPTTSVTSKAQQLQIQVRAQEQSALKNAKNSVVEPMTKLNYDSLSLAGRLADLRYLAIAESIATRTSMDLAISEARLSHEESILVSQVNDIAWRTVIRSGVVVLNQYEQGGFTAQDAADIVSIAQAVAVGVIAGRIR